MPADRRRARGWSLLSKRSPASRSGRCRRRTRSRSSITIVFSWWQCSGRSFASSAHLDLRVRVSARCISRTSRAGGPEERQRRARPEQDAHVDPLGQLGQQVAEDRRLAVALEREARARRYHPVRWTCDARRAAPPPSAAAPPRRRSGPRSSFRHAPRAARPATGRRVERLFPADAPKPPLVMTADLRGQPVSRPTRERGPLGEKHCFSLPTPTPEHARHCEARPSPPCCDAGRYELG